MTRKTCWTCKFWLDGWPKPELSSEASTRKVCEYSFTAFNFTCEYWESKSASKLKLLQKMAMGIAEASCSPELNDRDIEFNEIHNERGIDD